MRQRDQGVLSSVVNADELEKKLRYIKMPSMSSPSYANVSENSSNVPPHIPYDSDRSSAQSTLEPDYTGEECRIGAYKWYNELIEIGGRPSAPINLDPGVWDYSLCDEIFFLSRH